MFRMKFQTRDTAGEDEDSSVVMDRYEERTADSVGCSPKSAPTVIFEGREGRFGRIQRLSDPEKAVAHHDSSLRSLNLSPNVPTTVSKIREDADRVGPAQDAELPQYTIILDVDVVKEPVKPFAESLHVRTEGSIKDSLADKQVILTDIHFQTSVKCRDVGIDSMRFQAPALLDARTDSIRSGTSDADSECHSNYMVEGKPKPEKDKEALTGMISKVMQKKSHQPNDRNDKFAKPWEEPLLAAHDQSKLDLMAEKEAKLEAKRLADKLQRNGERQRLELQNLASCVSTGSTSGRPFRKNKIQKMFRFLKNPLRVFRSPKIKHSGYPTAREAKVMNSNAYNGCRITPSVPSDSVKSSMQDTSPKRISRSNIRFTNVDSTNRDVPGWTTEEYLRKNGRIPGQSNDKKDEEEFSGALGNNYMNNNRMASGVVSDYDSDSDSDSD